MGFRRVKKTKTEIDLSCVSAANNWSHTKAALCYREQTQHTMQTLLLHLKKFMR